MARRGHGEGTIYQRKGDGRWVAMMSLPTAKWALAPPSRSYWSEGCAGWHSSLKLCVPDHLHLLFLPPYSPERRPAEHLWPLTNIVLHNRHFATIDELEDTQAKRCVALQARPDLIRRATRFQWWPQRIRKRQGPRLK
jgi:hypothetical protein